MPKYRVTGPDGSSYEITAPEGATEQQALDYAKKQFGGGENPAAPASAPAEKPAQPAMEWGDMFSQAVKNVPSSATQFGKDVARPFMEPVQTAKSLYRLGKGIVELAIPGEQADEQTARAVGRFFADRYGGLENVKRTIAKDPVGTLADLSLVMSAGGGLAARAPGIVGKAGKAISAAGRAIDPITIAARGIKTAGRAARNVVGAFGTHTGPASLREAYKAGAKGGETGRVFRENMRDNVSALAVVDDAKSAVQNLRVQRGQAYQRNMAGIKADPSILDFKPIDSKLRDVADIGQYKGKVIQRSTQETYKKIADLVDEWRMADPTEFHTPAGLDALKQAVGDVRDTLQYGTPSRKMATDVYRSIRGQITKQAPEYARVMSDYEKASDMISDIEKTLSLNPKASVDTALRKLQSVLRNNANTNYGRRAELSGVLEKAGAANLPAAIAGQSLSSVAPRGLARYTQVPATLGAMFLKPELAALLPLQSPRAMGEVTHALGAASQYFPESTLRSTGRAAYQIGRPPYSQ